MSSSFLFLCFLFSDEPRRICFMLIRSKIIQRIQRTVYKAIHLTMEKKNIMMGVFTKNVFFYKETLKEKENAICFGRLLSRQVELLRIKASAVNNSYTNVLVEKESFSFFLLRGRLFFACPLHEECCFNERSYTHCQISCPGQPESLC